MTVIEIMLECDMLDFRVATVKLFKNLSNLLVQSSVNSLVYVWHLLFQWLELKFLVWYGSKCLNGGVLVGR